MYVYIYILLGGGEALLLFYTSILYRYSISNSVLVPISHRNFPPAV